MSTASKIPTRKKAVPLRLNKVLPPQDTADFLALYSSLIAFAAGYLGGVAGISDFKSSMPPRSRV